MVGCGRTHSDAQARSCCALAPVSARKRPRWRKPRMCTCGRAHTQEYAHSQHTPVLGRIDWIFMKSGLLDGLLDAHARQCVLQPKAAEQKITEQIFLFKYRAVWRPVPDEVAPHHLPYYVRRSRSAQNLNPNRHPRINPWISLKPTLSVFRGSSKAYTRL